MKRVRLTLTGDSDGYWRSSDNGGLCAKNMSMLFGTPELVERGMTITISVGHSRMTGDKSFTWGRDSDGLAGLWYRGTHYHLIWTARKALSMVGFEQAGKLYAQVVS